MFSGIITATGAVRALKKAKAARLVVAVPSAFQRTAIGASVCVSGACLTVAAKGRGWLAFDLSLETLKCTTLGKLRKGDRVNLERSLKLGEELGGHFVMGHVDAVGRVRRVTGARGGTALEISLPRVIAALVAAKGSIAVDGVSLTVNRVEGGAFTVMLVPHTLYTSALKGLKRGDAVNLEADVMARYGRRARKFLKRR